ncbi:disease resistance protein RPP8-like isoform X2 [Pyrus x bretschneideri]|nr:disease resistance protein RPP8-like isoform X2 [Pyrus x bretschneideri]XP_048427887.1 disease resistance protein RPP8-like isoform X2 [Pyrus x bretschneideri]XP_048427889.1 disease resistance protein RPP8-like isoform X2 [Pyrus x bretschneideri]XP_048427892.1 disease resistance protein RPP8-like isoform X2 [Pyrus x bretschneideri]
MAEAVVSMVIEGLKGNLVEEVKFLSGVGDQIKHAQIELLLMQGFLKDADAKQEDNEVVCIWVQIIRDAAYDLEDVIESFALKVALRRGGSMKLVLKRLACICNEVYNRHKFGSEIESITTKLSKLRSSLQGYNIKQITGTQYGGATSFERQKVQRETYPHVIERDVVGLEKDIEILVTQLVKKEKCPQVVSIWGMGGSGKTTLAKQVYGHNEDVKRHFDCFAWVCVSQQFQEKEVLEDILNQLIRDIKDKTKEMNKNQIVEKLCSIQKEKKCLVVLDDVWTRNAWNSLKPGFSRGAETKSCILLTTRKKDVAKIAGENGFVHASRALDDKESWELFKKIAISGRDQTNSELYAEKEKLGKKMLDHCAGLPLAITVLAGLVARKVTVEEWKTVYENVDVYIRRGTNLDQEYKGDQEYAGALRVLALSYDDLPYRLKLCFLYLGHFPEDYEIPVKRLAQLWIAEGFISSGSQRHGSVEVLEDVAYACLIELVERCMVQVGTFGSTKKIKTCDLHDLMRDLCLVKAEEENFLHVVNFTKAATIPQVRRLGVYLEEKWVDRFAPTRNDHLRSLLFFVDPEYVFSKWKKNFLRSVVCNFKLLRVLKLEDTRGREVELPGNIGNLVHLRFLSLRESDVIRLPSSLGNLVCLQTLDLRVFRTWLKIKVPNVIWKMKELRHLYLPRFGYRGKLKLATLGNLQSLVNVAGAECDLTHLAELTNLRKLLIIKVPNVIWKMKELRHLYLPRFGYRGKLKLATLGNLQSLVNVAGAECDLTHLAELTNLRKLLIRGGVKNLEEMLKSTGITFNHLRSLSLEVDDDDEGIPMNMVLSCPHIYKLELRGRIREQSLECLQGYENLTKMSLLFTGLQLESLKILEKIPNLRMLCLGQDALENVVSEVVVSEEGYPNLEFLELFNLRGLKSWSIEKGGMPSLRRLSISLCSQLRAVPEGLENVTTLKELTIDWMPKRFCSRVGEGGEDFYKIQHVPSPLIAHIEED